MVHHDQPGRETTSFEEVLGQTMTGKNVGIEETDPLSPVLAQGLVPHGLANSDLPSFVVDEHEVNRPDPGPTGLWEQFFYPDQEQADRDRVDRPEIDRGLGIRDSPGERVLHGFGLTVG
jgi:hypothetical protein